MTSPLQRILAFSLFSYTACVLVLAAASIGLSANAFGGEKAPARQKVIDFEDELVEGMNKRPLDSLSQVSEKERRRRKAHLYRKRVGFRSETAETLQTLRFVQ